MNLLEQLLISRRGVVLTGLCSAFALAGCNATSVPSAALPMAPSTLYLPRAADGGMVSGRASAPRRGRAATIALDAPIALAEDKHGNLYVGNAGAGANEVLIYDSSNKQLTSETITDGVKDPAGLAFDKHGNLYVVDVLTHEVTVYSPTRHLIRSKTLHTVKSNNFTPSGVAIDPAGNVWVASRNQSNFNVGEVQVFNAQGKVIHTITQHIEYPVGIVFVGSDAWVCDSTTPAGNSLTVFDANGNYVKTVSTPGFSPTYATLRGGNLYVTDGIASRLKVLDVSGSILKTIKKDLNLPYGIVFNKAGDFYVANVGDNTIVEFSAKGHPIHLIK